MVYMMVSDQFLSDYRVAADDIVERNHYDIFPEIPQRWQDIHQRCLAGAVEYADEDSFARLDGTVDYNCWECRPWYDSQGKIGGLLMYTEVITERKQAEEERQHLTEALQRQTTALRQNQELLQGVIDHSPAPIYVHDRQGRYLLVNHCVASSLGCDRYEVIGRTNRDFFPEETVNHWNETSQQIFTTGQVIELEESIPLEDGLHTILTIRFPIYNDQGEIYAIGGMSTDMTERKLAEQERDTLHQQVIEIQQEAIRELSTPLLPLAKGVIAMPLVGSFDTARAQQVVEVLLEGVANHCARTVILDITGVSIIDTAVADALMQATQAVRLLGAHVVLTGVQPRIAQTIVEQGIDMRRIMTCSTLQAGIAYALRP
jgi:anti-anti-sigma factor